MRALSLLCLAACTAGEGTLDLELATAPGSTLLESVQRVRLTLTNPPAVFEATRDADGLDISVELEGSEDVGSVLVEGFDASNVLIAAGQSPPFALSGADLRVVIYVAAPYSFAEAPERLPPARSAIAGTSLAYGAVFAGGLDAEGAPTDVLSIYNAYDHSIASGAAMPVKRANVALAANTTAGVYVFGGIDAVGEPTATLYRFQTNIAPSGLYLDLGVHPGLETAGGALVPLGSDTFLATGAQPALLATSLLTARTDLQALSAAAVPIATDAETVAACLAGDHVVVASVTSSITVPLGADPGDAAIAATALSGTAVVVGGATRDAYIVDVVARTVAVRANTLSVIRHAPTVASTSRYIVIIGGTDEAGDPIATAEVLDAATFASLAVVPVTARTHAVAITLPNDQIAVVGGDAPTDLIELFTPPVR